MSRRERLEQMLERQTDDPFLHYGLAMEWVKEGQLESALACFDRTLSIDAGYLAAYYHKATALAANERIEEARATLNVGIEAARRKQDAHAQEEMQALLDSFG